MPSTACTFLRVFITFRGATGPQLCAQVSLAAAGLPPTVLDADGFDDLLRWRKVPLFDNLRPEVQRRVVALGCPAYLTPDAPAGARTLSVYRTSLEYACAYNANNSAFPDTVMMRMHMTSKRVWQC